jgi:hypothetical protein
MIETVTYGEIRNGDRVNVQGYWFEVDGVRVAKRAGERDSMHGEPLTADVIRFTGRAVDRAQGLIGTGYDGATYGGYAWVQVARRVRTVCGSCGDVQPFGESCGCFDNGGQ